MDAGGILVDIRSGDERDQQGAAVPGALEIPLSVVLWRLDPDTETSGPKLPLDARVMLICRQGYSSSLAASQLREIGFTHATDVIGGVEAWLAAGRPSARRARLISTRAPLTRSREAEKEFDECCPCARR
jgi:rhodanese-related sulfurtransferase